LQERLQVSRNKKESRRNSGFFRLKEKLKQLNEAIVTSEISNKSIPAVNDALKAGQSKLSETYSNTTRGS